MKHYSSKVYTFRIPTGTAMKLRDRIVYGRLYPLKQPITLHRLTGWLGGLMDRSTVSTSLARLESMGLASREQIGKRVGWRINKELTDANRHLFKFNKDGAVIYWRMVLPVANPFKGKGGLEKWVAWAFWSHLEGQGKHWQAARIAKTLGMDRVSMKRHFDELAVAGWFDCLPDGVELQGRKSGKAKLIPVPAPVGRDAALENGIKHKAAALGWTAERLATETVDAAKTHRVNLLNGKYKGGSALKCLNARLDKLAGQHVEARTVVEKAVANKSRVFADSAERIERGKIEVERIRAEERAEPTIYDRVAAKILPGENLKPSFIRCVYTRGELDAAWNKIEPHEKLTASQLREIVRPAKVVIPTEDHDARIMAQVLGTRRAA